MNIRPRPIDINRGLKIVHGDAADDECAVSRSVPIMPTGMEVEEEEELHIKSVIMSVARHPTNIPTPNVVEVADYVKPGAKAFGRPKNFITFEPQEDYGDVFYDTDRHDRVWHASVFQASSCTLPPLDFDAFENLLGTFERAGFKQQQQGGLFTCADAQALCSSTPAELVKTVFDYWTTKRTKLAKGDFLLPQFKKSPTWNDPSPMVAFRPRQEEAVAKTDKKHPRKNDLASYKRMSQLRAEQDQLKQLLNVIKTRETLKKRAIDIMEDMLNYEEEHNDFSVPLERQESPAKRGYGVDEEYNTPTVVVERVHATSARGRGHRGRGRHVRGGRAAASDSSGDEWVGTGEDDSLYSPGSSSEQQLEDEEFGVSANDVDDDEEYSDVRAARRPHSAPRASATTAHDDLEEPRVVSADESGMENCDEPDEAIDVSIAEPLLPPPPPVPLPPDTALGQYEQLLQAVRTMYPDHQILMEDDSMGGDDTPAGTEDSSPSDQANPACCCLDCSHAVAPSPVPGCSDRLFYVGCGVLPFYGRARTGRCGRLFFDRCVVAVPPPPQHGAALWRPKYHAKCCELCFHRMHNTTVHCTGCAHYVAPLQPTEREPSTLLPASLLLD
eukprot:TRINITY_DN17940_c0_g1_i1.p1 TRINITY_DN17940_c0_g1~~TRINITY_DN17940_c0_g1_i1.p1  ORF type:complete len:630 (-),score=138.08 TRINITY_DN17940_c0_g1_i1:82-1920(-)